MRSAVIIVTGSIISQRHIARAQFIFFPIILSILVHYFLTIVQSLHFIVSRPNGRFSRRGWEKWVVWEGGGGSGWEGGGGG